MKYYIIGTTHSMQELETYQQNLILTEMLKLAPWSGWNDRTLKIVCQNLKFDENYYYIVFPQGVRDVITYYIESITQKMINELNSTDLSQLKVREKIYFALKIILDQNFSDKLAIKRIVSYYLLPNRTMEGLRNIYHIVNQIWYNTRDKSLDFNFYTKRFRLASIYISTLVFWINDHSKDNKNTLKYLQTKLDNALKYDPKSIIKKIFNISNIPFIRLLKR